MHELIETITEIIPNNSGYDHVFIDFETYSECDLMKCGASVYAEHPSTDIICLSYRFISGDNEFAHMYRPYEGDQAPQKLFDAIKAGIVIKAQNVFFEKCIWKYVCLKRGWPQVHYSQWRDTMAKSAMHAISLSLEAAGVALGLNEQKSASGKALIKLLSVPQKNGRRVTRDQNPTAYAQMYAYCDQDTAAEKAIDDNLLNLKDHEQRFWFINQRINERGIPIDIHSCKIIQKKLLEEIQHFEDKAVQLSGGRFTTLNQRVKILAWLKDQKLELPDYTAQTVEDALNGKFGPLNGPALELLTLRQAAGKSSTKKFASMIACANSDDRVRGCLLYHGAHTGRDAGRLIQPHNFAKPTFEVEEFGGYELLVERLITMGRREIETHYPQSFMNLASSALRSMIKPKKGKKLYAADYNAIEVRVLFWLAGCTSGLDIYRNRGDIYVRMASSVYRIPENQVTKDQRWYGKTIILGAGFGLGGKGFVNTCANFGIKVDMEFADLAIKSYRSDYPEVVKLWNGIEKAAIGAVLLNVETEYRLVKFRKIGNFLYCKLPQGRLISYPFPKIEDVKTPWGEVKKQLTYRTMQNNFWCRTSTYGGKLVENIVQATARDFMANGVINLEANGYPVILMVHDEIISEVDDNFGSLEEFESLMCKDVAWGLDCPILAEGAILSRYQKL